MYVVVFRNTTTGFVDFYATVGFGVKFPTEVEKAHKFNTIEEANARKQKYTDLEKFQVEVCHVHTILMHRAKLGANSVKDEL